MITHKDLVGEYRTLLASNGTAMLWAVIDIGQDSKTDLYFVVTIFPDQKIVSLTLSEAIESYNEVK